MTPDLSEGYPDSSPEELIPPPGGEVSLSTGAVDDAMDDTGHLVRPAGAHPVGLADDEDEFEDSPDADHLGGRPDSHSLGGRGAEADESNFNDNSADFSRLPG